MKKTILLIAFVFLVLAFSLVYAESNASNKSKQCSGQKGYCVNLNTSCAENYETSSFTCPGSLSCCVKKPAVEEKNKTVFVPWQKRNESECLEGCKCQGAVMSCETETGKIMTIEAGRSGNVITIVVNKTEANSSLEMEQEINETTNKTKLYAKLSNGRKAEVKIMPDTASEKAIERLGELNFTIQLKEVGNQLNYELQAERQVKVLGLFKARMRVKAEVNAENGETTTEKPWWAGLAS